MSLTGKSAVITGGSGGIGYEICKTFLSENLKNLAIIDLKIDEDNLKEIQNYYPNSKIIFKLADVTNQETVNIVYEDIKNQFQQINILVNSTGIVNEQNISQTLNVNIGGVMFSSIAAIKHMTKENNGEGGIIINVSSIAGLNPMYSYPIYSASKYAVLAFTRCLAHESFYQSTGIKMITLCPGATSTTMLTNRCEDQVLFKNIKYECDSLLKLQNASDVAKCVFDIIATGENGDVWVCEGGKYKNIEIEKIKW